MNNFMLFGVPETETSGKNGKNKNKMNSNNSASEYDDDTNINDKEKIQKIIALSGIDCNFVFKRLGASLPRPACVKISSKASRDAVYAALKKMSKKPELTGILILPDLTQQQLKQRKMKKAELLEKQREGQVDLTLRLVKGTHIIVKRRRPVASELNRVQDPVDSSIIQQ